MDISAQDHPCFPQPSNPRCVIWRYIDLPRFIWLLQSRKLYFPRVDLLKDPHEGAIALATHSDLERFLLREGSLNVSEMLTNARKSMRSRTYVSCWAGMDDESEALWRLYCGPSEGIALRSNYQALFDALKTADSEIMIGQVSYINYDEDFFPPGNLYYPYMHKRKAFSYECEIRAVKFMEPDPAIGDYAPGFTVEVDLQGLIDAVHVHPDAPTYYFEAIRAVMEHLAPFIRTRLKWSLMRRSPMF